VTDDRSAAPASGENKAISAALRYLIGRIRAESETDEGPLPIGPGRIAELRRLRPDKPDWLALPILWTLIADIEDKGVDVPERDVPAWALLMAGMARMTPHHAGGGSGPLGTVLAETGYPQARFLRLLRHEPDSLEFADAWTTATQWLRVKAAPINWHSARPLLFWRGEGAEFARRGLARDFYAAQPRDAA